MSEVQPLGIHHVTAVASDPQRNVDFYLSVLGLRLVKRTVNFDVPDTYHLYYGDEVGHPGTILTFFSWPNAGPGRRGTGQAGTVSFSVPQASLGWWKDRLESKRVEVASTATRLEEDVLTFADPDGLQIELVAHAEAVERPPWERGPVPGEHAIRGIYAVTLDEDNIDRTAGMLTDTLGFRAVAEEGGRVRFDTGEGGAGARVDVLAQPLAPRGLVAAGTVHHVAWRAPDEATEVSWRGSIVGAGYDVTPVLDRKYFRSIYFREPGGVLFEIATDAPGFAVDEDVSSLGEGLRLPPWLEAEREAIERSLAPLTLPAT